MWQTRDLLLLGSDLGCLCSGLTFCLGFPAGALFGLSPLSGDPLLLVALGKGLCLRSGLTFCLGFPTGTLFGPAPLGGGKATSSANVEILRRRGRSDRQSLDLGHDDQ